MDDTPHVLIVEARFYEDIADEMVNILAVVNQHPLQFSAFMTLFPWLPLPSNRRFLRIKRRLEEIVDELEKGELDIDKSLKIFEEGIKMSRVCSKKLNEAEKKIEKLTRNQTGELVAELFPTDEDEELKDGSTE